MTEVATTVEQGMLTANEELFESQVALHREEYRILEAITLARINGKLSMLDACIKALQGPTEATINSSDILTLLQRYVNIGQHVKTLLDEFNPLLQSTSDPVIEGSMNLTFYFQKSALTALADNTRLTDEQLVKLANRVARQSLLEIRGPAATGVTPIGRNTTTGYSELRSAVRREFVYVEPPAAAEEVVEESVMGNERPNDENGTGAPPVEHSQETSSPTSAIEGGMSLGALLRGRMAAVEAATAPIEISDSIPAPAVPEPTDPAIAEPVEEAVESEIAELVDSVVAAPAEEAVEPDVSVMVESELDRDLQSHDIIRAQIAIERTLVNVDNTEAAVEPAVAEMTETDVERNVLDGETADERAEREFRNV